MFCFFFKIEILYITRTTKKMKIKEKLIERQKPRNEKNTPISIIQKNEL